MSEKGQVLRDEEVRSHSLFEGEFVSQLYYVEDKAGQKYEVQVKTDQKSVNKAFSECYKVAPYPKIEDNDLYFGINMNEGSYMEVGDGIKRPLIGSTTHYYNDDDKLFNYPIIEFDTLNAVNALKSGIGSKNRNSQEIEDIIQKEFRRITYHELTHALQYKLKKEEVLNIINEENADIKSSRRKMKILQIASTAGFACLLGLMPLQSNLNSAVNIATMSMIASTSSYILGNSFLKNINFSIWKKRYKYNWMELEAIEAEKKAQEMKLYNPFNVTVKKL